MPTEVYLVKVGMSMTEGIVEEWYIPDGGQVSTGELLYRLETEKVNLDVDAETSGTLCHVVDAGVTLEPGDVVGYIYEAGEEIPDKLPNGPSSAHPGPVTAEGWVHWRLLRWVRWWRFHRRHRDRGGTEAFAPARLTTHPPMTLLRLALRGRC